MRQQEVKEVILLVGICLCSDRGATDVFQMWKRFGEQLNISGMVPPSLFIEPIIEVLVHILLAVLLPRFLIVVEIIIVNLRNV